MASADKIWEQISFAGHSTSVKVLGQVSGITWKGTWCLVPCQLFPTSGLKVLILSAILNNAIDIHTGTQITAGT